MRLQVLEIYCEGLLPNKKCLALDPRSSRLLVHGSLWPACYDLSASVSRTHCFVLETIRTGSMRVIHITVKTEETQKLRNKFVLYCPT